MILNRNINFMGPRKIAMGISIVLMLISVASLVVNKLNVGIDFTGGSVIEVGYAQSIDPANQRAISAYNDVDSDSATGNRQGSLLNLFI